MTFKTACDARASSGVTLAKRRTIEQQQETVREALADIDRFEVKIGQKDVSEARRLRSSSACSGLNLPVSERPPSPISSGFYDYSQTPRKTRTLSSLKGSDYNRTELKLGAASFANVPEGVIATNHGKLEWVVEKIVLKPRTTGITSVTARRVQSAGDTAWRPATSSTQCSVLRGSSFPARSSSSAGAALADIKQQRRGLKSAGTMSGSSEAGTFVNDIPDYEQGLDFEACDWLDDVENEHEIGEGWEGAMQQHRLSAAGARGGSSVSYHDSDMEFDKTFTYKDVQVFTKSQAAAMELQRSNSRAAAAREPQRPRSSWSGFSMLDSIYLPKSSRPRGYDVIVPGELFQRKVGSTTGLGPFETKFQATFVAQRSEAFERERKKRQDDYNEMLASNHKHKTDGRDDARAELRARAAQRVAENQASGVYYARTRLKKEQENLRQVQLRLEAKAEKQRLQGLTPAQAAEEARGCLNDLNAFDSHVKQFQMTIL